MLRGCFKRYRDHKFGAWLILAFFFIYIWNSSVLAVGKEKEIFSTWKGFEVDKCASIWLIKRFIEKKATIKFFPKGKPITEGIPFDTPSARFRRYYNMSTFESLVKYYRIKDPIVIYIAKIIHDAEEAKNTKVKKAKKKIKK